MIKNYYIQIFIFFFRFYLAYFKYYVLKVKEKITILLSHKKYKIYKK